MRDVTIEQSVFQNAKTKTMPLDATTRSIFTRGYQCIATIGEEGLRVGSSFTVTPPSGKNEQELIHFTIQRVQADGLGHVCITTDKGGMFDITVNQVGGSYPFTEVTGTPESPAESNIEGHGEGNRLAFRNLFTQEKKG